MGKFDSAMDYLKSVINHGLEGSTYIAHTSKVTRTAAADNFELLSNQLERQFDVKTYGAVGDGSTDDTAAIQAAITAATTANKSAKVVFPPGIYGVSSTITVGDAADASVEVVALHGAGLAVVKWIGVESLTTPILKINGNNDSAQNYLANMYFDCDRLCRGIQIIGQRYGNTMSNVTVYGPRQIGIDMIDCYNSAANEIVVKHGLGIAMRLYMANGMSLRNVTLDSQCVFRNTAIGASALVKYEIENGRAAAIAWFAEEYGTDWPATDDTSVNDISGNPVQTDTDSRAGFVVGHYDDPAGGQGHVITIDGLMFEAIWAGEDPCMSVGSQNVIVRNLYSEGNLTSLERIKIRGGTSYGGRLVEIDGVSLGDGVDTGGGTLDPQVACECLVRCKGITAGVKVSNVWGNGLTSNILIHDGGSHYGNAVERCTTWLDEIAAANWIGTANTPTVDSNWPDGRV